MLYSGDKPFYTGNGERDAVRGEWSFHVILSFMKDQTLKALRGLHGWLKLHPLSRHAFFTPRRNRQYLRARKAELNLLELKEGSYGLATCRFCQKFVRFIVIVLSTFGLVEHCREDMLLKVDHNHLQRRRKHLRYLRNTTLGAMDGSAQSMSMLAHTSQWQLNRTNGSIETRHRVSFPTWTDVAAAYPGQ